MEPKTEKKSIKNEVENKMRKKSDPRAGAAAKRALKGTVWRNAGAGWGGYRRGKRSARSEKEALRKKN